MPHPPPKKNNKKWITEFNARPYPKKTLEENIGETHQDKTIGNCTFNKSAKHRHQKQMSQMGDDFNRSSIYTVKEMMDRIKGKEENIYNLFI